MKHFWTLTACALTFARALHAAEPCPFPGQTRMLQVQMFLGQQDQDGHPISADAFAAFLETAATPRFPTGFTVYDAQGQWMDGDTHTVVRERAKILQAHEPDSADVRKRVSDLARIYRETFHQKSVGLVTTESCASFY